MKKRRPLPGRITQPGLGQVRDVRTFKGKPVKHWYNIQVTVEDLFQYDYDAWERIEPIPWSSDMELHYLLTELEEIWHEQAALGRGSGTY